MKQKIIKHCNDLNRVLPFMFEKIDDYTEILFPEGLLAKDSFIRQMTDTEFIQEEDWKKVEIIGWLYQYYIAEEKDRVIQAKKKYKTEEIPYATQLFTPDWIVRYMVQNSLGRYWIESHPEHQDLIENWEFYLKNQNPEPDFEEKLAPYINKELKVEDIKCFDPAMGSGHILVYMFDVLYEIYSKCGYMEREIPRLIIENNLYGLDIDDRASQLACFSVVMKALEYNSRFFRSIERKDLTLNLASIQETNNLNEQDIQYISGESSGQYYDKTKELINNFKNAKTTGSLIKLSEFNREFFEERLNYIQDNPAKDLFEEELREKLLVLLPKLIKQAEIMRYSNFDVVITNPPYIDWTYMNKELQGFIGKNYPNNNTDLFSAFIEYSFYKVKSNGQLGFVTPFGWMFTKSFEKIRNDIINNRTISSLIQLEYNAFEVATVPVATFTIRNYKVNVPGEFIKLSDFKGIEVQPIKTLEAISDPTVDYRYSTYTNEFGKIKGSPIAYWVGPKVRDIFKKGIPLGEIAEPKTGLQTGSNPQFTRLWFEVESNNIGFNNKSIEQALKENKKWFPFNKGGKFRKWAGNDEYVVNWKNDGNEIRNHKSSCVRNSDYYFKRGITWTKLTSYTFSTRYSDDGFIFSDAGMKVFIKDDLLGYIGALLNSKLVDKFLGALSETMNYEKGNIERIPVLITDNKDIRKKIDELFWENVIISKSDWDFYETSWNFMSHPLIKYSNSCRGIKESFDMWCKFTEEQYNKLKSNEEELNDIFIKIYGLEGDLSKDVPEEQVTVRKADKEREIKSFISYFVGCVLGRYSLDEKGLVYAGGEFNDTVYKTFKADMDNILPVLPGSYFEDDIVIKFIDFVKITFGEETLAENLEFIAETIGIRKGETAKETIRRYFLNDFFKDHLQTYKKRPIYWLFTSGKQKAFNCLIYMHRYDKTTLSRIRTDYLHEYQTRLDAEKKDLLSIIEGEYTTKEISNAKKELKSLDKKIEELKEYDELLHHMADMQIEIDLDDGVLVNYEKFKGLVAKI